MLDDDQERLRELSGPAWSDTVDLALRHGLGPLLHVHAQPFLQEWPLAPHLAQTLRGVLIASSIRMLKVLQHVRPALDALAAAGIPVVILKGLHLATAVYAHPAHRSMGDVDLLLHPGQLDRAVRVLAGHGYTPRHSRNAASTLHLPSLLHPQTLPIELHWTIQRGSSPFRIAMERLWERSTMLRQGDLAARALCAEDLLLHLCLHATYQHRCMVPLRSIYDIVAILSHRETEMRWDLLLDTSRSFRTHRSLYCGLLLATELFNAQVPSEVMEELALGADRGTLLHRAIAQIASHDAPTPPWLSLAVAPSIALRRIQALCRRTRTEQKERHASVLPGLLGLTVASMRDAAGALFRERRLVQSLLLADAAGQRHWRAARNGAWLEGWIGESA